MEQRKEGVLSRLAYLLRLILRTKKEERKERVYAWVTLVGCITVGIIICYILFFKPTPVIEDSTAKISISISCGDSIEVTAGKVAQAVYQASQNNNISKIVVSLSMAHASVMRSVDMGEITEDATEVRKYKDWASYTNDKRNILKSRISSMKYANLLTD